jgi:hypothetical protein
VLWPVRLLLGRTGSSTIVDELLRSQFSRIRDASLVPRTRCRVATKFFHLSPRLSGFVFRTFNFVMLSVCLSAAMAVTVLTANYLRITSHALIASLDP